MATRYQYHSIYGYEPPTFYKYKEYDDDKFGRGEMNQANIAIMKNEWQLIPCDDANTTGDPLNGLCRMGILDLLGHNEADKVHLVIPEGRNATMFKLFKQSSGGREMKRKQKKFLVVRNATVQKIGSDQAKKCSGRLNIYTPEGTNYTLDLSQFLEGRNKKVEIWKSMPEKLNQVSTFLHTDLTDDQQNARKRTAVFAYLLSESIGDVKMVLAIAKVYYQYRFRFSQYAFRDNAEKYKKYTKADNARKNEVEEAKKVREEIDAYIRARQEAMQSGFIQLCRPLLLKHELRYLHNMVRERLPSKYKELQEAHTNDTGNRKKKETDKFRVLFDFILGERSKSQKRLTPFMITAQYAMDAEGGCGIGQRYVEWMHGATSVATLRREKAKYAKKYEEIVEKVLKKVKDIWVTWDNFQVFTKMKFNISGCSTYATHATPRYVQETYKPSDFDPDFQQKQPKESKFVDENVTAPHGMFQFERLESLLYNDQNKIIEQLMLGEKSNTEIFEEIEKIIQTRIRADANMPSDDDSSDSEDSLLEERTPTPTPKHGQRVRWYMELLEIQQALDGMRRLFFRPKKKSNGTGTSSAADTNAEESVGDANNGGSTSQTVITIDCDCVVVQFSIAMRTLVTTWFRTFVHF